MNKEEIDELKKEGSKLFDSVHRLMTILMAGAIAWMVNTVNTTAQDIAVLKVKVEAAVSNRYSSTDALRDFALRDQLLKDHDRRLEAFNKELDMLRKEIRGR